MPDDIVGPSVGPNGEDATVLYWHGDHTKCGRFFIVETLFPKRLFPVDLFGRPGFNQAAVKLESEEADGGYKNREAARAWAACVAYQLDHGDMRAA